MKKAGLLNPELNRRIARLGHTDTLVVADSGLPVPAEVPVVDLALVFGIPRFTEVLDAVLAEIVVESATIADQARGTTAETWVAERLGSAVPPDDVRPDDVRITYVDHEELKRRVADAAFVVRTGETTSYANVLLHCGVPF